MQWPPIYVVWWKNYGDTVNTLHCNWKRWKNSTLGWNTAIIPPSRDQRWRRRWKALIFHHTWWNLKMHVATECGAKVALSILWDHHSAHNTLCMFLDHKCKIWTFLNLVNIYLGLRLYKLRKYKYHTKPSYVRHTIRTYLLTDEFHVNKKYVLSNSESVQCNFFHFSSRDVQPVQNLLLCTKFHQNQMIFHWDMAIYRFSKWRLSAILELFYHHTRPPTKPLLLAAVVCQILCQCDTQIWRYSYFNFFAYLAWNVYSGPQNGGFGDL